MEFRATEVEGCFIVELEPFTDERGYFARAWCADELADAGVEDHIAQVNMSLSRQAGMIRGLHWRPDPHPEAKFVRCIAGRIFDVCVDVRPGSPTYLRWVGVELTPQNRWALAVPAGCAHAYQALEDDSEIIYTASAPFEPGVEIGARWNDPAFGITWPISEGVIVSEKDESWPDYASRSTE
ncbi:MAG: dTDP-4-dehydrorhamnose 3,5-epimerase [Acidimicrobiia bacterium]|nr:dTDP-4-dehydrorhamnose 3,5-epimerase [Acidimicrobiia bacterium]